MTTPAKYPWFAAGDLSAFFALMLDNLSNLVLLAGILTGVFGFPSEFISTHMFPGTALGVLVGDVIYTWMAFRLAKRTGRRDVTAMPLGLDTPSTIGIALVVLGPVYLETKDPLVAWQVGMATMVLIGLAKVILSFAGDWIRRMVPQAGLLGSIAGVGIVLLGFLPLVQVFRLPLVGLVALGLVLYSLVAKMGLPGRLPGAFVAVIAGVLVFYVLGLTGSLGEPFRLPQLNLQFTPPLPTLGFIEGLPRALDFLPVAIPFGVLTIVGGINVTESARVAGDDYSTRQILLTEAVATLVAGVTGGVAQSTPYIGHPAYKAMGGRAGYTLATGVFVGLGAMLGIVSFIVDALPIAAVAPILIFVGLEITAQTFATCPKSHYPMVVLALLPTVADLVLIQTSQVLGNLGRDASALSGDVALNHQIVVALGNGFILTAMLWGAFGAHLVDRRRLRAAGFLGICAVFSLFGIIHSVKPDGSLYLPWTLAGGLPVRLALAYGLTALLIMVLHFVSGKQDTLSEREV